VEDFYTGVIWSANCGLQGGNSHKSPGIFAAARGVQGSDGIGGQHDQKIPICFATHLSIDLALFEL
jgi:hypothetical protein